jgi:hypothetical protein
MSLNSRAWVSLFGGLLIMLLGITAASIATVQMARRYMALSEHGQPADGVITNKTALSEDPLGFRDDHSIEITFTTKRGIVVKARHVVNPRIFYQHMLVGEELEVLYLPERPTINAFKPRWWWINFDQIRWMSTFGGGFMLCGAGLLWQDRRQKNERRSSLDRRPRPR